MYYADDPHGVWNVPFFPGGSCDGKCASADDIENFRMWGIFGRADGEPFDADALWNSTRSGIGRKVT